jgi:hypothetical protein
LALVGKPPICFASPDTSSATTTTTTATAATATATTKEKWGCLGGAA